MAKDITRRAAPARPKPLHTSVVYYRHSGAAIMRAWDPGIEQCPIHGDGCHTWVNDNHPDVGGPARMCQVNVDRHEVYDELFGESPCRERATNIDEDEPGPARRPGLWSCELEFRIRGGHRATVAVTITTRSRWDRLATTERYGNRWLICNLWGPLVLAARLSLV